MKLSKIINNRIPTTVIVANASEPGYIEKMLLSSLSEHIRHEGCQSLQFPRLGGCNHIFLQHVISAAESLSVFVRLVLISIKNVFDQLRL